MSNPIVQLVLFMTAWLAVIVRLRFMDWKNVRKNDSIALNIWLMMFLFAIGLTFCVDFIASFDRYIANNFSRWVAYCTFLLAVHYGTVASLAAVELPEAKRLIRRLWALIVVALLALLLIYIFYLSRLPNFIYFQTPQSLPEALLKLIVHACEIIEIVLLAKVYLAYLPLETSPVMRLRVVVITICSLAVGLSSLTIILVIAGYFWEPLAIQGLVNLSELSTTSCMILLIAALVNNKTYVQLILLYKGLQDWRSFRDLKSLVDRLLLLCPVIGLPPENPAFWQFLGNPEYYLYRTIITILDSKAMLSDFLAETRQPSVFPPWEDDLMQEALYMNAALQAANPSNDFTDIVNTYRHISRNLSAS